MRILLQTAVRQPHSQVFARFDHDLLEALTPFFIRLTPLRMDSPIRVGGVVHIRARLFGLFSQEFYNRITEYVPGEAESWFTDEGERLPWMFGKWRHVHRVVAAENGAVIRDEVEFEGRNGLLTLCMLPMIWLQFRMRRPVYRRIFA